MSRSIKNDFVMHNANTRHTTPALFLAAFGKLARRIMPDNDIGHLGWLVALQPQFQNS